MRGCGAASHIGVYVFGEKIGLFKQLLDLVCFAEHQYVRSQAEASCILVFMFLGKKIAEHQYVRSQAGASSILVFIFFFFFGEP